MLTKGAALMVVGNSETIRREDDNNNITDGGFETLSFLDYAKLPAPPGASEVKYRGGVTTHFPALVHAMLSLAESDRYHDVCGWSCDGRSFSVYDRDVFVSQVMPLYFRQTQFPSFQRQLNLYGFRRLSQQNSQEAIGSYYHPMFLRTRQDLCPAIQRESEKEARESKKNAKKSKCDNPDFSCFDPLPPIRQQHIDLAKSITIPQRKSCIPKFPQSAVARSNANTALGASRWPKELFDASAQMEEKSIKNAYSSLFLNDEADNNQLDLSWMEPTPMAPAMVVPQAQHLTTTTVTHNQGLEGNLFGGSTNIMLPDRSTASVISSYKDSGPSSPYQDNLFGSDYQVPSNQQLNDDCLKRSTKRGRTNTNGSFSTGFPGSSGLMSSAFLEELDLDFSDSADFGPEDLFMPQDRRHKTSPHPDNHVCSVADQQETEYNMPRILSCQVQPLPAQQVFPRFSRPKVELPRTFKDVGNFPGNELLVITRSDFPFSVISMNTSMENLLGRTRAQVQDKPLISFSADQSETAKLNATVFAMLGSTQDEEVQVDLILGSGTRASFLAVAGPFYANCDHNQIHGIRHVVWHFQAIM